MSNPWEKDTAIGNVILCLLVVLVESLQLLIAVALVFSFIPIPVSPLVHGLMPRQVQFVQPEREMTFYHFWVGIVLAGQAAVLAVLRKQLDTQALRKRLLVFLGVECLWLFLMGVAVFKIFVYGYPSWGMHFLYAVIGGALLSKLFWKELCHSVRSSYAYVTAHPQTVSRAADILFPLLIAGLIAVPDLQAVLARMWIGDSLIHMDTTLMGLVWALAHGEVLNVDVWSHYGLGMPILITLLAKGFGALSYTGVLSILVWSAIIYFIMCYFFLRAWLKSIPVAIAGTLIAIKWQMFHPGNYPFVFTYPYSTVFRNIFDIAFFFVLLVHLKRGDFYLVAVAGGIAGLALFHISDTGVYLFLAYVFYLFWLSIEDRAHRRLQWKNILMRAAGGLAAVMASFVALLLIFQGGNTWSKAFWVNMSERADLFLMGHGNLPMYKSLLEGDYSDFWMSLSLPLIYAGVLAVVFSLCVLKKIPRQQIMAAVMCVYGMGLYHYYVCRSANTAFDTGCIPFVFVLGWICIQVMQSWDARQRHAWGAVLLGLAAFALFSNHAFLSYPNIFNRSPNPIVASIVKWPNKDLPYYFNNVPRNMNPVLKLPVNSLGETDEGLKIETDFKSDGELKDWFNQEFDYSKDAAMIDGLTAKDQPIALFSSFETRILMQADRKPFFYYYPIIDSGPRRMRMFPFSRLLTVKSLDVTMKQLEQSKPEYVFLEKIFLTRQVPQAYEYLYPDTLYILAYLNQHYKPYIYGQFLVALKRI